jgi:hypothetical protein
MSLSGRLPQFNERRERTMFQGSRGYPCKPHGRSKRWLAVAWILERYQVHTAYPTTKTMLAGIMYSGMACSHRPRNQAISSAAARKHATASRQADAPSVMRRQPEPRRVNRRLKTLIAA